ncbi:hypothetical protein ACYSUW_14680 [Pseudomonas frederiksbergensis]
MIDARYSERMTPAAFRTALVANSEGFLASVIECLRNETLKAWSIRLLIEMEACSKSDELTALVQAYILSHPTDVSRFGTQMHLDGFITLTENSIVERHPQVLHTFKASVAVVGREGRLVIAGTGSNYKIARIAGYQDLMLQLCGIDGTAAVFDPKSDPPPVIPGLASPHTLQPDQSTIREGLEANSDDFMPSVAECLRNGTLKTSDVRLLIETDAWKGSDEVSVLLQDYIVSHPTEVSGICGQMRDGGFISLTESRRVEHFFQTRHIYEASVTVTGAGRQLQISGGGPSYQVARTVAYQRLLLQLCGGDVESTLPDPKQNPWSTFLLEVGGRTPTTILVDEDPHRNIGYQATASFTLDGRVWDATGATSPWKAMARQAALDALFLMVTKDLDWQQ